MSRWRQEFQQTGPGAFEGKRKEQRNTAPAESPEDLKKIIGELTVQNELLKKSRGLLGDFAHIEICGTGPPDLCFRQSAQ
jgi:transposase-like protein